MTRKVSSKRALATVVSTAIIMSSVAIMGTMLVGWSNANLLTKQNELETSFNTKMNKLNESILVESSWFGTNPNVVNFTLSYSGSIGLNVTEMHIKNSSAVMFLYFTDGGMTPTSNGTLLHSGWLGSWVVQSDCDGSCQDEMAETQFGA